MRAWVLLIGALLLAGCGGGDKVVMETEDGVIRRSADGETITYEGRDGARGTVASGGASLQAAAAELSGKLPAYAPLYPGATLVSTMTGMGGSENAMLLVMETGDSMAEITAFYDARIRDAGVSARMSANAADSATRMVADANGRTGTMISVSDGGDIRTVTLTVGSEG